MGERTEATEGTEAAGPEVSEALSWVGERLDEIGGETVGKVDGVYVDAQSGRTEWLLVRIGRFGGRAPVPAREAVGGVGRVWVPYREEAIKHAPKVDPRASLTRDRELQLLSHFGIAGQIGRAAELAERDHDATTARPAS
jgi:sporulation protein YlmC with PRC-barrel domain